MEREDLEQLFERFRQRGDAAALERVFDRAAPEVLRVAFHLVGDADRAEDLVQATFLAAIEHASAWDRTRPLLPWLLGILANRARRAREASAREHDPGRLRDRMDAVEPEDPAHEAERAELRPTVDRALDQLPATYREVLTAHLLEGRRAADIARDSGRPPGTVRMQILRGLELLRRALPAGLATGAAVSLGTGRGLAAVRQSVLERAVASGAARSTGLLSWPPGVTTPGVPAGGVPAGGVTTGAVATGGLAAPALVNGGLLNGGLALGGMLVTVKSLALAACACAVLAGAWFVLSPGVDPVAPGPAAQVPAAGPARLRAPAGEASALAEVALASDAPEEARAVVAAADPADATPVEAAGWFLVGTVRGLSPGTDPEDVVLNVFCHDGGVSPSTAVGGPGPDGSVDLNLTELLLAPGRRSRNLLVSANHPMHLVGNAIVRVDAAELERGRTERVEFPVELVLQPAAGVDGRVVVPAGAALDDVEVGLFPVGADGRPWDEPVRSTEVTEDGSFEFRKRLPGAYRVVATGRGLTPAVRSLSLVPDEIADAGTLHLAAGGLAIAGTVVLPADVDVEGCRVRARRPRGPGGPRESETEDLEPGWRGLRWDGERTRVLQREARTDAKGAFVIAGLPHGPWEVALVDTSLALVDEPAVLTEAPAEGVLLGEGLGIVRVAVTSAGEPRPDAEVLVELPETSLQVRSDASGRVGVLVPLDRDVTVSVDAEDCAPVARDLPAAGRALDELVGLELVPIGPTRATLVLELRLVGEADFDQVQVHLLPSVDGGDGEVGEDAVLHATLEAGSCVLEGLPPGRYRVEVEPHEDRLGAGYESLWRLEPLEVELVAGREHRRFLVGELGGRLRLEVEGVEDVGDVERASSLVLRDAAGAEHALRFASTSFEDNVMRIGVSNGDFLIGTSLDVYPNLPPGRYALRAEVEGHAPIERTVDVFADQETVVTLRFRRVGPDAAGTAGATGAGGGAGAGG